ncbi:MAG: MFS transporter [Desulfobacula sp.]
MLILSLGFNALLTSVSLEKLYMEAIVSKYNVIGKDLQRNLENALRFGKTLEKFVGMEKLLKETQKNLMPKIENKGTPPVDEDNRKAALEKDIIVSISKPDGQIVYSTDEQLTGKKIPEIALLNDPGEGTGKKTSETITYVKYENYYIHSLPIREGMNKKWIATAVIFFNEKQIKNLLHSVLLKNIKTISIIILFGASLLIFLFKLIIPNTPDVETIPKFKISVVLFSVIALSQLVFTGFNTHAYKNYYLEISMEKNRVLSSLLREDIEYLLDKGISIDRLLKMDTLLGEVIAASPEIDSIMVSDREKNLLYLADKTGMTDFVKHNDKEKRQQESKKASTLSDPTYHLSLELIKNRTPEKSDSADSVDYEGFLSTNISKDFLFTKLKDIALDSITVLAISIFFLVELLILELQLIEKQLTVSTHTPKGINYLAIRPVAFIFIFGIDICISFLPLHMENLYNPDLPIFGLSKDIVMGLPISMQMFFTSISLLISGAWCDKRGWHEPFLVGLFLSGSAFIYAWIAPTAIHFIFSLGLVGMGYGLSLMASQGFIIAHTMPDNKTQGMAQLFAGVYAGSICGGAAGAMLADRIGYQPVFLIGGVILFFLVLYTVFIMRDTFQKPVFMSTAQTQQPFKFIYIVQFLFNRRILMLILFNGLPWYIMLIGFLNYYSPIYLKSIGTSQSNIGRIFMLYGICLMYIAPIISRHIGNSKSKKFYLAIGSFFGSLCIASFYFLKPVSGIAAITLSIFLLGISACFIPVRNTYILDFEITQKLGGGKAMGILNSVLRLGQVFGPILFGWLFFTMGSDHGIAFAGIISLVMTLIFVLMG